MQLNNVKLPFGLIDDKLKHIDDVPNGRACGCVCPKCKRPLEARNKGKIRASYFAHYNSEECSGATETAVHRMAKQIIAESKVIKTPIFNKTPEKRDIQYNSHYGKSVKFDSQEIKTEQAILEEQRQGYKPDITLIYKNRPLLVEIKVTHKVDEDKQLKVKNNNEEMIEIDLSDIDSEILLDMAKFENYVIYEAPRHWIHNPHGEWLYQQSYNELNARVDNINIALLQKEEELKNKKEQQNKNLLKIAEQKAQEKLKLEIRKSQEREKYKDKLSELQTYLSYEWQYQRELLQYSESGSFPIVAKIENAERIYDLPQLINMPVKNDWIFNVYRSVWQADIITTMIFNSVTGKELNANNVKKVIISRYSILPVVKELNNLKQEHKKIGRERDEWYQDFGCWFLSKEESRLIPSPFQPIIEYLNYLSDYIGIIKPIGNHCFSILVSNSKEYIHLVDEDKKRRLIAAEKWEEEQKIILEKEEVRKIKKQQLKDMRIEEIIASEKRVFELFNGNGRLCKDCYLLSHSSDGNDCPFCGANEFQVSSATAYHIENAHHRYRCYASPSLSIKSHAIINNELLAEWLNNLPTE
ncbi:hypothetical protein BCS42_11695 [Crenothrix sp. D3]|nr:hypothetical protein BCS42_11695 [Crenothrix sp. D3]